MYVDLKRERHHVWQEQGSAASSHAKDPFMAETHRSGASFPCLSALMRCRRWRDTR